MIIATIAIVGCGAAKQPRGLHQTQDLYTGPLFTAARRHVEARGLPWAVLSAKHGLLSRRQVLASYDYSMADRDRDARVRPDDHKRWMFMLGGGLWQALQSGWLGRATGWPSTVRIEVHAGRAYVETLREAMAPGHEGRRTMRGEPLVVDIVAPLEGLQVGERLAWYKRAATGAA